MGEWRVVCVWGGKGAATLKSPSRVQEKHCKGKRRTRRREAANCREEKQSGEGSGRFGDLGEMPSLELWELDVWGKIGSLELL